ncbi:MAG: hypothetical protein ACE5FI_06935, partial [Anaerolineales bacterium]
MAVGLLLVFVATRYHNLAALPVFFDEAESIRISKKAWTGPHNWFLGAHLNRLLYIWWVAIFWPFTGALWISRAANLFVGLAGLAAILATGRLIGARGAGLLAVALYITVPVAFFFDRIVLGEHMQMAISASLLFSTGVLLFHRRRWAVFVCGLLLTGYWLTKGTGFFWLGTPLLLLPTLPIRLWRSRLRWLAATYGVGAVSSLPFVLLLIRI